MSYLEIVDMIANGATTYYDEARQSPYLIQGDQWIGYDNQRSLQVKVDFLKSKGLRGSMVWAIELDDFRGQQYPLLNTIKDALAGYRVSDATNGPTSSTAAIATGSCVPCTSSDAGCTHPGQATQDWCDDRCTNGVNNDFCPVGFCKCGGDLTTSAPTEPALSTTASSTSTSSTSAAHSTSASTSSSDYTQGPISDDEQVRVCYFQNWLVWTMPMLNGQNIFQYGFDPSLCTHINYGFGAFGEGPQYAARMYDPDADVQAYAHLNQLKAQYPHLKSIWSTGGWTWNDCTQTQYPTTGANTCHLFSEMVASEQGSRNHAKSVIAFLRQHGFDGYDIDWEYPVVAGRNGLDMQARPDDKANYVRFLRILREEFDAEAAANPSSTKLLLTAAVGVGKSNAEQAYDIPSMNQYLDWIGLMTYDLHGYWDQITGLNAGLYSTPEDIAQYGYDLSVSWATDYWISHGASPDKLLLGLAPYGRGFTLANVGLNQGPLSAVTGPSTAGPQSTEAGYMAYHEIVDMIASGANKYYDEVRQAPYIIKGNQWIGYDNPRSLRVKVDFLKSKGLRGVMVWAIELDDFRGQQYPCLNAIKDALAGYRQSDTTSTAAIATTSAISTSDPFSTTATMTTNPIEPGVCVPCTSSDAFCTHPGQATQEWCDGRCTEGVNNSVCPVGFCTCGDILTTAASTEPASTTVSSTSAASTEPASSTTVSSTSAASTSDVTSTTAISGPACVPCTSSDAGCTHPLQASQQWCDGRCTEGVNNSLCPLNYCTCSGGSNPVETTPQVDLDTCVPCSSSDSGCTHPGQASQEWCDGRCTEGVNSAICPVNFCTCPSRRLLLTEPDMYSSIDTDTFKSLLAMLLLSAFVGFGAKALCTKTKNNTESNIESSIV